MEAIIEKDLIKDLLQKLEVPHDELLIDSLSQGKKSKLLTNIRIGDNDYQDGTLRLFKDKNGLVQIDIDPVYPNLDIPTELFDKKLNPEEIKELENKGSISINYKDLLLQVSIDKETNSVIVKSDKEITSLDKPIGGYTLSESEKESFLEGNPIGPKVLYNEKTKSYIQATIQLTDDKMGFKFSGVKSLTKEQAEELTTKFNQERTTKNGLVSTLSDISAENITNTTKKTEIETKINLEKTQKESPKNKLEDYLEKPINYEKLIKIKDQNPELLNPKELSKVFESDNYIGLPRAEQIAVEKAINSTPEQLSVVMDNGEFNKLIQAKEYTKVAELSKTKFFTESQKAELTKIAKEPEIKTTLSNIQKDSYKSSLKVVNNSLTKSVGLPSKSNALKL